MEATWHNTKNSVTEKCLILKVRWCDLGLPSSPFVAHCPVQLRALYIIHYTHTLSPFVFLPALLWLLNAYEIVSTLTILLTFSVGTQISRTSSSTVCSYRRIYISLCQTKYTWCVQVLRSPTEAFAAAMQSWCERCEKCVCLQGDYVEKWLHFQLPMVSSFFK